MLQNSVEPRGTPFRRGDLDAVEDVREGDRFDRAYSTEIA